MSVYEQVFDSFLEDVVAKVVKFESSHMGEICSWVKDQETLQLISGDKADQLTPEILAGWITSAVGGYSLIYRGELVGFATISYNEWTFPEKNCEICHLIINPEFRRMGFGTMLVHALALEISRNGFNWSVARIVPDNIPAKGLIKKANWNEVNADWINRDFEWYTRKCVEAVNENVARLLTELREEKKLKLKDLADLAKISPPYMSMLENEDLKPPRIPSMEVLKSFIQVLCPDDPAKSQELALSAIGLYSDQAIIAPRSTFPYEAKKQIVDTIKEVWIVSDKIGENVDAELYEATVKNMVDRGVKYKYFIPIGNLEWSYLLHQLQDDDRISDDQLEESVMCVECNPMIFVSRIAIFNPGRSDENGTISIGPTSNTQLYDLETAQLKHLINHLEPVVHRFKQGKERSLQLKTGEFNLVYPMGD